MICKLVTSENIAAYEAFIAAHPKGHFLQSSLWAKVKPSWKWQAVLAQTASGEIRGAMSVLVRKMPGLPYTLMYSARGPVCDPHDTQALAELTRAMAGLAKRFSAYALKIDPDIPSGDSEFISSMTSLGYHHSPVQKNFDGIQPGYVFRLDIRGKTEEELLAAFHSKTRYNLRLSVRKGVTVRQCGKEMLTAFSEIMKETGDRDGFIVRGRQYFETMLDSLGEHARLYMAFHEDKPVAGTLAVHFGNKVWYLYGASSNAHRNVMPNYQLQWSMIKWALELGCDIYDFRGVSGDLTPENPLYGLYLFKKGFSGDLCEFCGEFEMVYKPFVNWMMTRGLSFARKARRMLTLKKSQSGEVKPAEL